MSQRGSVERILDAVVKLVATYGPDTTTVRNVAAEAEVSVGAVQHHYRTNEELLVAAMTAAGDEFRQLAAERTGAVQGPREQLQALLQLLACVFDEDLSRGVVWTAFASRAATDPSLRALHVEQRQQVEQMLRDALRAAYPDSGIDSDDAAGLLALCDGIAVARAAEGPQRIDSGRAQRLVEQAIQAYEHRGNAPSGRMGPHGRRGRGPHR